MFQLQNQIDSIFWERQFQKDLKADAETLMINIARMSHESEQTILEQMQINRQSAHSFSKGVRPTRLTLCTLG